MIITSILFQRNQKEMFVNSLLLCDFWKYKLWERVGTPPFLFPFAYAVSQVFSFAHPVLPIPIISGCYLTDLHSLKVIFWEIFTFQL
jgi:hypothetical protein